MKKSSDRPTIPEMPWFRRLLTPPSKTSPITLPAISPDFDFIAKDEVRERLSATLREVLALLWGVDFTKPNTDLLLVNQDRDRVAVCDAPCLRGRMGALSRTQARRRESISDHNFPCRSRKPLTGLS